MEHLDDLAHTRLGDTATAEDIGGVVRNLLRGVGGVRLQQADGAAQVGGLLGVAHVAHLVGDGFEPGLVGLAEGDHAREPARLASIRQR